MAYYLQKERYTNAALEIKNIIGFEHETAISYTDLADYEADPQAPPILDPDFYYHEGGTWAGAVDILKRGQYLIYWQMAPISDCPLTGEVFQLQQLAYDPIQGEHWIPLAGQSTHLFSAAATGFYLLDNSSNSAVTVALWQNDSVPHLLSNLRSNSRQQLKGRLFIYGLSENDGDLTRLIDKIRDLQDNCKDLDLDALECLLRDLIRNDRWQDERIYNLQLELKDFEHEYYFFQQPSCLREFELVGPMAGIYVNCMRNGHIYHFTTGRKTGTNHFDFKPGQAPGTTILPSANFVYQDEHGNDFQPFSYLGSTILQTGWLLLKDDNGTRRFSNIHASNRGLTIFFRNNGWTYTGDSLEFTMHIIMAPPRN